MKNDNAETLKQIEWLKARYAEAILAHGFDSPQTLAAGQLIRMLEGGTGEDLRPVVAGALHDFAGYITTQPKVFKVGAAANAARLCEHLTDFLEKRGITDVEADVANWRESLP